MPWYFLLNFYYTVIRFSSNQLACSYRFYPVFSDEYIVNDYTLDFLWSILLWETRNRYWKGFKLLQMPHNYCALEVQLGDHSRVPTNDYREPSLTMSRTWNIHRMPFIQNQPEVTSSVFGHKSIIILTHLCRTKAGSGVMGLSIKPSTNAELQKNPNRIWWNLIHRMWKKMFWVLLFPTVSIPLELKFLLVPFPARNDLKRWKNRETIFSQFP